MWYHLIDISLQLSKNKWCCSLPPIPRSQKTGFGRTGRTQRLQPTAFGVGMRGESCQPSLWLLERVLPESAAAEPQR